MLKGAACKTRGQQGFSLVELILAILIGLILIGGVMSLYVSTRGAQRNSDEQLRMVNDARYAIETIGYDLRHAGSWGATSQQISINCRLGGQCSFGDTPKVATGDCATLDYTNLDRPLFGANDSNPYGSTCATNSYKANTDILQVRYADSSSTATDAVAKDTVYVRANVLGGKLFVAAADGVLPDHNGRKWLSPDFDYTTKNYPLVSHVYYVSENTDPGDGIPSLRRVSLEAGPKMKDEVVLSGVEDLQVQYGVPDPAPANKCDKTTVATYVNANAINTDLDWQKVTAVKVYILMRSLRKDRAGIKENRTFSYAGKTADESDGYHRFLASSVINLRNTNRLDEVAAGRGGC